jgi:hypothetical protein
MNLIGIYKINNKLFFLPSCSLGEGLSVSIEPILESYFDDSDDVIGNRFLQAFRNCKNATKREEMPEDSFKKFLQITKVRSQINLVKQAQLITTVYREGDFTFKRIGANIKYKGFMVDLGIAPIVLNESAKSELIGKSIKELFLAEIIN